MYTEPQHRSRKEEKPQNSLLDPSWYLEPCSIFKPLTSILTFDQAGEQGQSVTRDRPMERSTVQN